MVDNSSTKSDWRELVANHQKLQRSRIPQEWHLSKSQIAELTQASSTKSGGVDLITTKAAQRANLLSAKEIEITESYTATELLSQLADGRLNSVDVTTAFCKRAAIAQQLTSCLTEVFFTEAIQTARELDELFESEGKVKGPLHGLPISLKDSFVVDRFHATVGFSEYLRSPPPQEQSALVNLLQKSGAVLYCKTNVPQTMMTADPENNIFGRSLNPHNTLLTAGGSTGGEASLLAFRGSPLGVGTDIAGSIRIPSLCCGIYGFKPTANRVPFGGQVYCPFPRYRMPEGILPAAGPMGHSIADLETFMQAVSAHNPWRYDPCCVQIPWNTDGHLSSRPLRIGVLPEDSEYNLHPPMRRAMNNAVAKLHEAGHTIVRLVEDESRSVGLAARIAWACYYAGQPSIAELEREMGEPLISSLVKAPHPFSKYPSLVTKEMSLQETASKLGSAIQEYAGSWHRTWVQNDLDIVLAPGGQHTTVPYDEYGMPGYTCAWNVVDYPACFIPYGRASAKSDPEGVAATAGFDPDYKPDVVDGAHCGVQVITPRFQDEQCLAAAKIVDTVLNSQGAL
ncbi:amidase signature domain-containing protein [Microdochium bolleyi]|uniref:Amidase signature domain-containing protein n=1 Tax=Microdochium bolleyi TaxID=196109 RepID=A0A136J5R4_9PEZI|nr:amidase signature domain-containing protein [Microdochium bolleyi]